MQVTAHRHRTHAVAIQSAKRVPSRLQSDAYWEPKLLHIIHNEDRIFLSSRSWWSLVSQYVDADGIFLGWCGRCGQSAGVWFIWTVMCNFLTEYFAMGHRTP